MPNDAPPSGTAPACPPRRGLRKALLLLCAFILLWPAAYLGLVLLNDLYNAIDPMRFPDVDPAIKALTANAGDLTPIGEKGAILSQAIYHQLERELDAPLGWTANDILPTRWLDNRASRERGVLFATRMLQRFFATRLSKYGAVGQEDARLKEAREKRFVYGEDIWGFFRPSAEHEYRAGIALMRDYEQELRSGKAIFNLRSDDMYELFTFILGRELLDQPMGLLVAADEEVPFTDVDNRIYYAQGVMLVVRDVLYTLDRLYPWVREKGGENNLQAAFAAMNEICSFDPILVVQGSHDSMLADHRGKMARYYVTVISRLNDVAQAINR